MSRSAKTAGQKTARGAQPDILAMLLTMDAEAPLILDELELSEAVAVLDGLLSWLTHIQPRVRRYLTRRAGLGRSGDLDMQMVDDLRYYRLLQANLALLRERLLQEPPQGERALLLRAVHGIIPPIHETFYLAAKDRLVWVNEGGRNACPGCEYFSLVLFSW